MYAERGTGKKELVCKTCGKGFIAWAYEARNGRKFCSPSCRSKKVCFQKGNRVALGNKHSAKTRKKMSESHKGNTDGFQIGQPSVFKGEKRENLRGKNHWNWQGGITPINQKIRGSLEYKIWEDGVKSINKWNCQKCGDARISKLVAHHIQSFAQYPELRFALDNGIAFCRDCHKEFHKIYGRKDNVREQVEEFLQQNNR